MLCDSPWKPWTLIAGWRSRCKSAFPATVMIAGMVSVSTSLRCRLSLLLLLPSHSTQPREKKSRSHFIEITRALNFFPLCSFLYLPPKFGDVNERTPKNYCRREKYMSDIISGRVYSQDAIFIAYAIMQKIQIYIRVFSHWSRITDVYPTEDILLTINWSS